MRRSLKQKLGGTEGNCHRKGVKKEVMPHGIRLCRGRQVRTSGSTMKVTFTGAVSVELWEAHPECSGKGMRCRKGVRVLKPGLRRNREEEGIV